MSPIEFGSRVTGKIGGLPVGGKGSGFQAIGNIGDKRKGLKFFLQSLSFLNVVPLRSFHARPSIIPKYPATVRAEDPENLVPFLHVLRNHFCELLLLRVVQIALKT